MPFTVKIDPTANSQQASIIPDASLKNDGVMTKAMVAELNAAAGAVATTGVSIYVDPVNGNDNQNGNSPNTAVKSLGAAVSLLPPAWKSFCHIVIINNGVTPALVPAPANSIRLNGNADFGIPLVILSNPINIVTATQSVPGNTITITDPGLALVPNSLRGKSLTGMTGANAQSSRLIVSNTVTSITVNYDFFATIGVGDTFQVNGCGAFITGPNSLNICDSILAFYNVGLKSLIFDPVESHMLFIGSEWDFSDPSSGLAPTACYINANGLNEFAWANDPVLGFPSFFDLGNGIYLHDTTNGFIQQQAYLFDGWFVFDNVQMRQVHGRSRLFDLNAINSTIKCQQAGIMSIVNFASNQVEISGGGGVSAVDNSTLVLSAASVAIDISNCSGDAVFADTRSYVEANGVTGTGNGGVGIHVQGMSQASFSPGTTTVTGANDTSVGTSIQNYAALTPNGFSEVNGGGPTLNRIAPFGV